MKIRYKLIILMLFYIIGISTVAFMSIQSRLKAEEIQKSINLGAELQLRSREVQSHMKDIVFDLFAPKMYNQLRSLTFSPRSAVTIKQWQSAVIEYNLTFNKFMKLDHFFRKGEDLIRDQYFTAITMNERASEMLSNMEETLVILRSQYRTVDNLYNAMQKEESLIPFFNEFQETSYYFKNSFESFMNYFIESIKEEGKIIQKQMNFVFICTSIFIMIISLIFTLFFSRDLVGKLNKVETSFRMVAKGNFSTTVDIHSKDEFGAFAGIFNELISDLKENVISILNLTKDIGGFISDKSNVDALYELVAMAVIQDTAADTVMVIRIDKDGTFVIEAERGNLLIKKEEDEIKKYINNQLTPYNRQIYIRDASQVLGLENISSILAVPLLVEGKSFGFLISIKRTPGEFFSDLGIIRLATFAEYASLTIDNYFKYQELLERRDAKYQALQSQVQPHFLYNILGVILGLNRSGEREKITETVSALKDMLRYIQSQNSWTSLEEECQFIEQYCLLQKIRFESRFTYSIIIDEKSRHFQIPRLLFQPLVENSVIHGIEPLERGGHLEINCKSTRIHGEQGIKVTIVDNGKGFNSENMDRKMNIGLLNVQQRLKIAFPESTFFIESQKNEGTTVRIEI
ncbi:MAG: histidine kinase [Spirochaetaceae bacterium]|nr:histidine kinase [Spirochaetaceae bacterium]